MANTGALQDLERRIDEERARAQQKKAQEAQQKAAADAQRAAAAKQVNHTL